MKVLVADGDLATRRELAVLLRKGGYEVVLADSGQRALDLALSGETHILILDAALPVFEGLEVCTRVRDLTTDFRPYILLLSTRQSVTDIVATLDAGADDFVPKPFDDDELLARVRVGRRTVTYQMELQRRAADADPTKARNKPGLDHAPTNGTAALAGVGATEHAVGPTTSGGKPALAPAQAAATATATTSSPSTATAAPAEPAKSGPAESELTPTLLEQAITRALATLGLTEVAAALAAHLPDGPAADCGWSSVLAVTSQRWIDVMLEGEAGATHAFFERKFRRAPGSHEELHAFLAECCRTVAQVLGHLLPSGSDDVFAPLPARARAPAQRGVPCPWHGDQLRFQLSLGRMHLLLTVVDQPNPLQPLAPSALKVSDVLREQYPPPGTEETPMLLAGTALTPRFIEKLSSHYESRAATDGIAVHRPSRIAQYFLES